MKRVLIAALIALPFAACAQASERRMDVKGMLLGATLDEMRSVAKLKCQVDASGQYDMTCRYANAADRTFAGIKASDVLFGLFDGRLDTVAFDLPGDEYRNLKAALDGKFGEVTPQLGVDGLCVYMMNGDRAYLMYQQGNRSLVWYESAGGAAERQRRADARAATQRKDM